MGLNKPTQDLKRELKMLQRSLEQAAAGVLSITKDCEDVDVTAVLKLMAQLYEASDRLAALTDQVKHGRIVRAKGLPGE